MELERARVVGVTVLWSDAVTVGAKADVVSDRTLGVTVWLAVVVTVGAKVAVASEATPGVTVVSTGGV